MIIRITGNEMLGLIIDLMRREGFDVDGPYDIQNFFEDYASSSEDFIETGRFKHLEEKDDEDE